MVSFLPCFNKHIFPGKRKNGYKTRCLLQDRGEVASQFANSFKKMSAAIREASGDIAKLSQEAAKPENLVRLRNEALKLNSTRKQQRESLEKLVAGWKNAKLLRRILLLNTIRKKELSMLQTQPYRKNLTKSKGFIKKWDCTDNLRPDQEERKIKQSGSPEAGSAKDRHQNTSDKYRCDCFSRNGVHARRSNDPCRECSGQTGDGGRRRHGRH